MYAAVTDLAVTDAVRAAQAADNAFEVAIKSAGYKSRWDWRGSARNDNRPRAAYEAKLKADSEMHHAFERNREYHRQNIKALQGE